MLTLNSNNPFSHLNPWFQPVPPSLSGFAPPAARVKRAVEPIDSRPTDNFPSVDLATKADAILQKNVTRWMALDEVVGNIIPPNASIEPALKQYIEALNDPKVQDWFIALGFKPGSVRVFNDSVTGTVVEDGKDVIKRFSLTDGSGWWAVGAKVRAAQALLSPSNLGVPIVDLMSQAPLPAHIILDFYGLQVPLNERALRKMGGDLKKKGWPPISAQQRSQWREKYIQASQVSADKDVRTRLYKHIHEQLEQNPSDASRGWQNQAIDVDHGSALDQCCVKPRKEFLDVLRSPTFQAFLEKIGTSATEDDFRIHGRELQCRDAAGQWTSLQAQFDDEVANNSTPESLSMKAALNQLFDSCKLTGNALYASRSFDVRQALDFYSGTTPRTTPEINAALGWLNSSMAPAPLAGDYAALKPYGEAPGALSTSDLATLAQSSEGINDLLAGAATAPDNWNLLSEDPDEKLANFFDSPAIVAKAQEWAQTLKLAEVAGGATLPRATRHQLVATAIKLSLGADLPGNPGEVAGYEIYQPGNSGRSIQDVRGDIEAHLVSKGVNAASAPLVAHLFLAQSAPEMLVKADKSIPPDAPKVLRQRPEDIKIGSAAWMELRLGCAMADSFAGVGASRMMNSSEIMALTRLQPQDAEQNNLIRSLRMRPLLDWAIMEGVIPKASDGKYSPQVSKVAADAYALQQTEIRQAFANLMEEPPTLTSLLIKELVRLFPEMTEDEIRNFKLRRVYNPLQHHLPQEVPLTEVLLAQQDKLGVLGTINRFFRDINSGQPQFSFYHPQVSSEVFAERIKALPDISTLVAPAIDRYVADERAAYAVTLKLMISQLPPADRKALENGKVEFFQLRKETGDTIEFDSLPDSNVRKSTGTHGTLMRYETPGVEPGYAYYEVFPSLMTMIKRTDLPRTLKLGGTTETEASPVSTLLVKHKRYSRGKTENFDFEAYANGTEPRAGVTSSVIIGRAAPSLPSKAMLGEKDSSEPVPRVFKSTKIADIVETLLSTSFDDRREKLTAHANRVTEYQARRAWPFGAQDTFSPSNLRMVLSMIPFVGALADLAQGQVAAGVKGLLLDFASFAVTGGLGAVNKFFKGFKTVLPFGGRALSYKGLKGTSALLRSLFNPLDGVVDLFKSAPRVVGAVKVVASSQLKFVRGATAFERSRWCLGVYGSLSPAHEAPKNANHKFGSCLGETLYAVQIDNQWYAIDPRTQKPTGVPLTDFVVAQETGEPEAGKA
jgi:hypothetical protein